MKKLYRPLLGTLMTVVALLAAFAANVPMAQADTFTQLMLQNGWVNDTSGGMNNAAVANIAGIVHFRGTIRTTGTNPQAFTLPVAFRPAAMVYVPTLRFGKTNCPLSVVTAVADVPVDSCVAVTVAPGTTADD